MMIDVAIIPREKFSKTGDCLRALTPIRPHLAQLIFFDVGYPYQVRDQITPMLEALDAVSIAYPSYRLANACLNDLRHTGSAEWILVLENDCEIVSIDLESTIAYAEAQGFDVVQPRILEQDGATIHYDPPHSYIDYCPERLVHRVIRNPRTSFPAVEGRRRIYHIEKHAFLIRRRVLASLGSFEEFLVTRSHWDLSFRLNRDGHPLLLDPSAIVKFSGSEIASLDVDYFRWRWNVELARESNDYIQRKWHIDRYHSSIEWLEQMLRDVKIVDGEIDRVQSLEGRRGL